MNRQENKWLREHAEKSGETLESLIIRRKNGEPLQYILGEWEFYGYPFKVGKGVLIPRPETELLVDLAKQYKPKSVLDLCAGTGCVGIALAREINCKVIAVEKSEEAIKYLKQNIELNNAEISIKQDDVLNPAENYEQADCILINPPYLSKNDMENLQKEVSREPEIALFGGIDGLDFYKKIFKIWDKTLKSGGLFAVEVGDTQAAAVAAIVGDNALGVPQIMKDLAGTERIIYYIKT